MERPRKGHALVGTQFLVRGSWWKGGTQYISCAVGLQGTEFLPTYSAATPSRFKACTHFYHFYWGTPGISGKARDRAGSRKTASGKAGIRVQEPEDASEGRRRDGTGFCVPGLHAGRDHAPSQNFSSWLQNRLRAVWRLKPRFITPRVCVCAWRRVTLSHSLASSTNHGFTRDIHILQPNSTEPVQTIRNLSRPAYDRYP